jgi:hypothetical protein
MTLGEYAQQIAAVILQHGQEPSVAVKLIAGADGKLLERHIPLHDRRWFWQEVANQLSARRPVTETPLGSDPVTRAREKVLEHLHRISA